MRHFLCITLVAAAVVAGCGSDDSDTSASTGQPAAGTTETTAVTAPAADGTPTAATLVFQDHGRIRVVNADGSDPRAVTSDVPVGQEHPDWSHDGTQLAFEVGFAALWTVDADGTDAQLRFECAAPCQSMQDAAWSPDGHEIAFMVAESEDGVNTSRSAILGYDVASGDVRTIYEDTSGLAWLFHPRWSPDGSALVFEEDRFPTALLAEENLQAFKVGVVATDGSSTPSYVVEWAGPASPPGAPDPDWSPTTDLIVFSRGDNLFTVQPDASELRQITDYDGRAEHAIQPTFSPTGAAILFTYFTGTFGVDDAPTAATIGLDGDGMTIIGGGGRITHPRLRP